MKSYISILRHITLIAAITLLSTSCSLAKISKLSRQVQVLQVGNVSIKGSSAIAIDLEVRNQSDTDVRIEEATMTLNVDESPVATLTQVGEIVSHKGQLEFVSTLWKIDNADPMMMLILASRLTQKNYESLTIDFSLRIKADNVDHTLSDKSVDISKFMKDFKL